MSGSGIYEDCSCGSDGEAVYEFGESVEILLDGGLFSCTSDVVSHCRQGQACLARLLLVSSFKGARRDRFYHGHPRVDHLEDKRIGQFEAH
jgi:hypothetical protein